MCLAWRIPGAWGQGAGHSGGNIFSLIRSFGCAPFAKFGDFVVVVMKITLLFAGKSDRAGDWAGGELGSPCPSLARPAKE